MTWPDSSRSLVATYVHLTLAGQTVGIAFINLLRTQHKYHSMIRAYLTTIFEIYDQLI
jgi:hypothetical protein